MASTNNLDTLTQINLNDLVASFGWQERSRLAGALQRSFRRPASKFARQMLDFDADVGNLGLAEAAKRLLQKFASSVRVFGRERLPKGPVLALSNHPGTVDTLALFVALGRNDLRIIADANPFLTAMPHVAQRLDYVAVDSRSGISLIRRVSTHLRSGGAVLTFPSGRIEPDPNVYPGAEKSLQHWTDSVGVFLRLAPETTVVPVLVRGVIWARAARHPLTKLKRNQYERERLVAALQLLGHVIFNARPLNVTVQIGNQISGESLGTTNKAEIHQAVLAEMRQLIAEPPEGPGENIF